MTHRAFLCELPLLTSRGAMKIRYECYYRSHKTGRATVVVQEVNRGVGQATMASVSAKQPSKLASKSASGASGAAGAASNNAPILPLASPLMGGLNKKKKPFLGMPAPLGYVPGLGRG